MGYGHSARARRRDLQVGTCFVVCCLLTSPATLAELPTMERFKEDLASIQAHLSNVTMKARHGMAGISGSKDDGEKADRPPTPAEACCASNIDAIKAAVQRLTVAIEQWGLHYSDQRNSEAVTRLQQMRGHLGTISQGIAVFKMAGTKARAVAALQGLIRPVNEFRAATEALEACCSLEPKPQPGDAGGTAASKTKDRSETK